MKLLVLEDDLALAREIERVLRKAGYAVDVVTTIFEADLATSTASYGCLVFDRMVSDGDGADLVSRLRARADFTPALLITARDALADRVEGLESGADDYLVKPFAAVELVARIRALARRGNAVVAPVLVRAGVELDVQRHAVRRDGVLLAVRAKEFAVLEELLRRAGTVVTRTELIESCWDGVHEPNSNVVDAVIVQLRKRLGDPNPIRTIRGVGYRFEVSDAGVA